MNNLKVTFKAHSPYKFTGSHFRRKPYESLLTVILTRYIPFPLKYPATITIVGDEAIDRSIIISNETQFFRFTYPRWDNGWYSFDSIFAEELNSDRKTKKVLHIYVYGVYYFGKVSINDVVDIYAAPFQNALIVLKDEQKNLSKHYHNCTELICRLCEFLKDNSSFSFLDVVKIVLASFSMHISDFEILNVEGVINFYHGSLVSAKSYFDDSIVEAYITHTGCELTCATKNSIIQKFPDGCIAFKSDLLSDDRRQEELQKALERIEMVKKQTYIIPTN